MGAHAPETCKINFGLDWSILRLMTASFFATHLAEDARCARLYVHVTTCHGLDFHWQYDKTLACSHRALIWGHHLNLLLAHSQLVFLVRHLTKAPWNCHAIAISYSAGRTELVTRYNNMRDEKFLRRVVASARTDGVGPFFDINSNQFNITLDQFPMIWTSNFSVSFTCTRL